MSLGLRVRMSALVFAAASCVAVAVASAQSYDAARQSLDLFPDPLVRAPRLLGMGRLTLLDDGHNRTTLWDFAGNPTGVLESDTTSTLEFRPATASASSVHFGTPGYERQDLAARDSHFGFEAWRRTEGSSVYGAIGDLGAMRLDRPYDAAIETRSHFNQPNVMPVLNGRLPYTKSGRWLYALRLRYGHEADTDEYRGIFRNGAGEYIDKDGTLLDPPNAFNPNETSVTSFGAGAALAYKVTPKITAAIGADGINNRIVGSNDGNRHASGTNERRPYGIGQASLVGTLGPSLDWGVDARGWKSSSEASWVFTVSAGVGQAPLTGRGKLLEREEEGSTLRSRVRWHHDQLMLAAGLNTTYRRVTVTPPDPSDRTSIARFFDQIHNAPSGDTLAYADTVVLNRSEERTSEGVFGASWTFGRRATLGAEFHAGRAHDASWIGGDGPKRKVWDVRTGLECGLTPSLVGRAGFIHRSDDRDEFTLANEYIGNTATAGLGLQPKGASWILDAGYALEWLRADFGDPGEPHGSRQQIAAQIRWVF